jgi:hypothetical protein
MSEEIERSEFNYLKWFPDGNKANEFRPKDDSRVEIKPLTIRAYYYEEWIQDKVPPLVRKSLAKKYKSHFCAYILDTYGENHLDSFKFNDIKTLRIELVKIVGGFP